MHAVSVEQLCLTFLFPFARVSPCQSSLSNDNTTGSVQQPQQQQQPPPQEPVTEGTDVMATVGNWREKWEEQLTLPARRFIETIPEPTLEEQRDVKVGVAVEQKSAGDCAVEKRTEEKEVNKKEEEEEEEKEAKENAISHSMPSAELKRQRESMPPPLLPPARLETAKRSMPPPSLPGRMKNTGEMRYNLHDLAFRSRVEPHCYG